MYVKSDGILLIFFSFMNINNITNLKAQNVLLHFHSHLALLNSAACRIISLVTLWHAFVFGSIVEKWVEKDGISSPLNFITDSRIKGYKNKKKCMCLITALASGPKLHEKEPTTVYTLEQ